MTEALTHGFLAGYGIAIPVGAISILIVETGIRCGLRCAMAAGAGAATADLIYAAVAAAGGAAIATAVDTVAAPFRYASAVVLAAIALAGLMRATRKRRASSVEADQSSLLRTYRTFVGMTIINPLTIVYFTVFVVGSGIAAGFSVAEGALFVATAFAASLSWQMLLAGVGGVAHHALPDRFRLGASVVGNSIVLSLALIVAFG